MRLEELLGRMHGGAAVPPGWDTVLSLSQAAVDALAARAWDAETGGSGEKEARLPRGEEGPSAGEVVLVLGAPEIELGEDLSSVAVRQPVLRARLLDGRPAGGAGATEEEGTPIELPEDARIEGWGPVALSASADGGRAVTVGFAGGELALRGLDVAGLAADAVLEALLAWLAEHLPGLTLVGLHPGSGSNGGALRQRSAALRVLATASGRPVLQLLTSSQANPPEPSGASAGGAGAEPIPTEDGSDYSFVLASRALFENVIVPGYNRGTGRLKLVAVAPEASDGTWSAEVREPMRFQGSITGGDACEPVANHTAMVMRFGGSLSAGLELATYAQPGGDVDLQLTMEASYPIKVTGHGEHQRFHLVGGPSKVAAAGVAENAVKPQLEQFLHRDVHKDMTAISFGPVSSMLLEGLAFPGGSPRVEQVRIPGDLLVTGTFEAEPGAA